MKNQKGSRPKWRRQILHVMARNKENAATVYRTVKDQEQQENEEELPEILVVISITKGLDSIYTNKRNPPTTGPGTA